jgi:Gram-negative porin
MRRLLLAATSMVGATLGMATIANAQSVPPTVTVVPPPNPLSTMPGTAPQPGNVVVRLNARITAEFMVGNDNGSGYRNPTTGVAAKAQGYYMGEFARLYPAFDGETANGVKYGASLEARQNSGGTGVNTGAGNLPGSTGNTLYWRREMGYVGTDKLGTLRFGATDGVESLFLVGTFENFDYEGGWNGYLPGLFSPVTQLPWDFADASGWYTTSKLIYLSPNFSGFDFGLSWEPSSNQTSGDMACGGVSTTVITSGCGTVSSISGPFAAINADLMRRRNTTEMLGRYRGAFGPVGLVAEGGWVHSGTVADANSGIDPASYNGMNFFDGGAVLTYGGLAFGGHVTTGVKNNTSVLVKGGKHEMTFSVGASYAVGPFIVGASFINESFQGAWNGNAQTGAGNTLGLEHDIGVSAGASYDWAPGATLYVDYLWGTRHQANHDFFANTTGTSNNNTRAEGLVIGQNFRW